MRARNLIYLVVVLAVSAARPVAAQDAGAVGVAMGYPGALGVVWHVTDGIALRPDVSVTRSSSETTSTGLGGTLTTVNTAEGWNTAVGLSVLVTVKTVERLKVYVAPRLAWSYSRSDNESGAGTAIAFTTTTKGVIASGSFGAQYLLHDRFAIFGELGLQYSGLDNTSDFSGSRSSGDSTTVGLRSAVGATFYF